MLITFLVVDSVHFQVNRTLTSLDISFNSGNVHYFAAALKVMCIRAFVTLRVCVCDVCERV